MSQILRRRSVLRAAAGLLATPALVRAETGRKRIYMMLYRGWEDACDGFRDYLRAQGLAADFIIRSADQTVAKVADMVAEAKSMQPDLVYIWGTGTAIAALGPWDRPDPARNITDIPAVFNIVIDPVGNGIVRSLEHTGRNATGTTYVAPILVQLRTMASYKPFKRIGIVYNPQEQNSVQTVASLRAALPELGGELVDRPVAMNAAGAPDPSSIPDKLRELVAAGCDWLYIAPDTFLLLHRALLTQTAVSLRLPSFAPTELYIRDGDALFGLVCRYYNIGQFTGLKAEQILRGGKPADSIPVETLGRFNLLGNMRAAKALELYPPLSMLRVLETV